ncbi:MAG: DUF3810 domain-containing protein [Flavisolibacter sp.]
MLKSALSDRYFLVLLVFSFLVKLFSLNEAWVERYYTYGFYPWYSRFLRMIFGWIPFSIGDLLYFAAFVFLVMKLYRITMRMIQKRFKEVLTWVYLVKILKWVFAIYLVFNISWGLNYNRLGIARQLQLNVTKYSSNDLRNLTAVLLQRLNESARDIDTIKRMELNKSSYFFNQASEQYNRIAVKYPWLSYSPGSMKNSMMSAVGHYFGFSGYINPFTNEAHINTKEPVFTKAFVVGHEIAHQVGYGKENEASFVSYLICKDAPDPNFRYSVYYELFFDAFYEYRFSRDTATLKMFLQNMEPRVRLDWQYEIAYRKKRKNNIQPYISDFYNHYLKLNNQPHGLATYNEVTAWLIAYMRKYGVDSL